MNAVTVGLYSLLSSDATLTGLLSKYKDSPAIFSAGYAPTDAVFPYVVISGDVTDEPEETKTSYGREIIRDVECYDDGVKLSQELVETIAERVRVLTHRSASLAVTGYEILDVKASGALDNSDDIALGRLIQVTILMMEA